MGIRMGVVSGLVSVGVLWSGLAFSQDACKSIIETGGVPIELVAVATGPSSVNLTWSGFAGRYDISTIGSGAEFHASTTLKSVITLEIDGKSQDLPGFFNPEQLLLGALTHTSALPASIISYVITGALADGRKACGTASATTGELLTVVPAPLSGWVDLHTHPLSNLGFGGKLLYGGVDVGSLLPRDPDGRFRVRATDIWQALGHDKATHGGPCFFTCGSIVDNGTGDELRAQFIHQFQQLNNANDPGDDASGFPGFKDWPKWNDITHQKMWVDWIRRAYDGGLRVMVALAVNNKTTADAVSGDGDFETDDKSSADLQITEIKSFVGRHLDFMEIALTSADLHRIVRANKLAVVLGIEVDNVGNMHQLDPRLPIPIQQAVISNEIGRLFDEGVRYIFPIHILDNPFGGTAAYEDAFNLSNWRETGHWLNLVCTNADGITYQYKFTPFDFKTGFFLARKLGLASRLDPANQPIDPPIIPTEENPHKQCTGMVNSHGLTDLGSFAIKEMMRRGMLIDIDHMSEASREKALDIADSVLPGYYPLNSGHSGLRCFNDLGCNERSLTAAEYGRIGKFHGMVGIGSADMTAFEWTQMYLAVIQAMGPSGVAGFGTDTNGFAKGMPSSTASFAFITTDAYKSCVLNLAKPTDCIKTYPPVRTCIQNCGHPLPPVEYNAAFPASVTIGQIGNNVVSRFWNYNTEGVAHYGMLPDFLQAVRSVPGGASMIKNNLMHGADYFFETWRLSEEQSKKVPSN